MLGLVDRNLFAWIFRAFAAGIYAMLPATLCKGTAFAAFKDMLGPAALATEWFKRHIEAKPLPIKPLRPSAQAIVVSARCDIGHASGAVMAAITRHGTHCTQPPHVKTSGGVWPPGGTCVSSVSGLGSPPSARTRPPRARAWASRRTRAAAAPCPKSAR